MFLCVLQLHFSSLQTACEVFKFPVLKFMHSAFLQVNNQSVSLHVTIQLHKSRNNVRNIQITFLLCSVFLLFLEIEVVISFQFNIADQYPSLCYIYLV